MPPAKGFTQINFQVPDKTAARLDAECKKHGIKRGEYLTRMLTMYYLAIELGQASDIFDFFSHRGYGVPSNDRDENSNE